MTQLNKVTSQFNWMHFDISGGEEDDMKWHRGKELYRICQALTKQEENCIWKSALNVYVALDSLTSVDMWG